VTRPRVVVGTWFTDRQPGFQDFRQRIESLSRNYDVILVLRAERFRAEFPGLQARIVVLDTAEGRRPMLGFIRRLAGLAREIRPDLVCLLGSQLALCTFLLGRRPSALYWNEHPTHVFASSAPRPGRRLIGRLLVSLSFAAARRATMVMPIGEAHGDDLRDHGLAADRVELVPMGVEDAFAGIRSTRAAIPTDSLGAVYAGTVSEERGRDVMIEGLARATHRGARVRLTVVGASEQELRRCTAMGERLGVADRLQVVGRVPGSEIPGYLARSDVGVCLWADRIWWRFNPPTKLFEYLAAGLPVLASRIRTHTAYVRDDFNGLIFDYDAESFAAVLLRAWRERARLPVWSDNAFREGQRFLWSKIEPRFLHSIRRALDGSVATPR